ncbi:MAG: gas vesicle protein K [Deltaproteobacteria bacterium]|nr:gas vesicle protein K [Deltaproteobacteria bacterium]
MGEKNRAIDINEENLKQGLMALVVALLEIINSTLRHQAIRRMDAGSLTDEEIERLGSALKNIDRAVEEIKEEHGIKESVRSVRDGLDDALNDIVANAMDMSSGYGSRQ